MRIQGMAYLSETGDVVAGKYCNVSFRGKVTSVRYDTANSETVLVSIQLDTPIMVFGAKRESIQLGYNPEHKEASSTYIDTIETGY